MFTVHELSGPSLVGPLQEIGNIFAAAGARYRRPTPAEIGEFDRQPEMEDARAVVESDALDHECL